VLTLLINLLFPPQCLNCKARVPDHGTLCLQCWQSVQFISDPMCDACGLPFEYDIGADALCGECLQNHPPYKKARAALTYNEHSSKLITRFKYADQTSLAKIYGDWLASAGKDLLTNTDIIIPVPLHYFRFVHRRYNQSALLAQALAKKTGIKHLPTALKRERNTKQQTGLTRRQRATNVKNAFSINTRYTAKIKNKNILLIDDVLTTGATLTQCTKALLKAGAASVNVLTLARTTR